MKKKWFGDKSMKMRWSWERECKSAMGSNKELGKGTDRLSMFVMHSSKESLATPPLGN